MNPNFPYPRYGHLFNTSAHQLNASIRSMMEQKARHKINVLSNKLSTRCPTGT